ncbi:hypothetical protein MLD38_010555 [Melastoma candidum]|uniref:Uncharacterized protein n=1 Tax=Melastoma candidum TaxID=119954 RepID=A0ACB9R0A2_9MYRT|nr:hypothetical protein MLD38_010555 [Melastoma candidum]
MQMQMQCATRAFVSSASLFVYSSSHPEFPPSSPSMAQQQQQQQRSHVPKFGNWDNNNIPYTAFFEDARKEKSGVRMNPNDPEENPEVFAFTNNIKGWEMTGDDHWKASPANSERHGRSHPMNMSRDKSNPGDGGRGWSQSNGSVSLKKSPRHHGQGLGNRQTDGPHRRTASIPKFGAWDERDPSSGGSFTVIFDRVKEEKHNGSGRSRAVRPQQERLSYIPGSPMKQQGMATNCASKICCCFFSRGSD